MEITRELLDRIVDHARREAPKECCGVVVTRDGRAVEVVELENLAASPLRFEVDGPVLIDLLDRVEDEGAQLGVIYHSHTRSAPEPSQTDINFSAGWPGVEWLIVGLAGGGLEVRSWLIDDGEPREVAVEVRDDG